MSTLAVLGLSQLEEAAYRTLITRGACTSSDLSSELGVTGTQLSGALDALVAKGLALASSVDANRFSAAPPESSLGALVHEQQQALLRVQTLATTLAQEAARTVELQQPQDLLSIVVGLEECQAQFLQLLRSAQQEVLAFDRPPHPRTGGTEGSGEELKKNVRYRTVYDAEMLENPAIADRVRREVAAGEDGRAFKGLPLKLVVCDRAFAMLPLTDPPTTAGQVALIIRPSVLLDSLVELFEAIWARATPLRTVGDEDDYVKLAQLLSAGLKDAAIARSLGVTERTVRRRVADLTERLGVETRFQAGRAAAELGWI